MSVNVQPTGPVLAKGQITARVLYADPLTIALRDRMLSDPKLANEAVTGGCFWPPEDAIGDLAFRAADKAQELIDLALAGEYVASFEIETLLAAEMALIELEKREKEDEREQRNREDEARYYNQGSGWSGVFR